MSNSIPILILSILVHSNLWAQAPKGQKQSMAHFSTHFPHLKKADIEIIDHALKNYGQIGQIPGEKLDHSKGLEFYLLDHNCKIQDTEKAFLLHIFPKSGRWEFSAQINKSSGRLENPVVATIEPEP